jgi:hypothetical protein
MKPKTKWNHYIFTNEQSIAHSNFFKQEYWLTKGIPRTLLAEPGGVTSKFYMQKNIDEYDKFMMLVQKDIHRLGFPFSWALGDLFSSVQA